MKNILILGFISFLSPSAFAGSIRSDCARALMHQTPVVHYDNPAEAATLDDSSLAGTFVDVSFMVNQYGQSINTPDIIRQRISIVSEMDSATQILIWDMKNSSGQSATAFFETAAWMVYTKRGVYRSDIEKGNATGVATIASKRLLKELLRKISSTEGRFEVEDVEFFHTHLHPSEAFNRGDVDSHDEFMWTVVSSLEVFGVNYANNTFVSHAVPVLGRTFFSYKNKW